MNKQFALLLILWVTSLVLGVSKPPNYVSQSNEGKLYSDEELTSDQFKLNFKLEGADRFMVKKLLSDTPECLEVEVLNLLIGVDPYTSKIDKILEDPQEVEKVKNTFKKAIECARVYLEKMKEEESKTSVQNPEETEIRNNYDKFNEINNKLYVCTHKVLRCYACRQDCERYSVLDKDGNLSKVGLKNAVTCYDHCLGAINILPPPPQSQFCERCLDTFFVTDRELCNEECDYNPFKKCASSAGDMQNCLKVCKEKFDRYSQLPDLEGCIEKCKTDLLKKYGKTVFASNDKVLPLCFNLPLVFENIEVGKKVDFAELVGVCILPGNQASQMPGIQPPGPCPGPGALPQQPPAGSGSSTDTTGSSAAPSASNPPSGGSGSNTPPTSASAPPSR